MVDEDDCMRFRLYDGGCSRTSLPLLVQLRIAAAIFTLFMIRRCSTVLVDLGSGKKR